MKRKNFLLLVFVLLAGMAAVAIGYALSPARTLSAKETLQLKKSVETIESLLHNGTQQEFDSAIASIDDSFLLSVIAEVSLQLEETDEYGALAAFNTAVLERVAPNLTPDEFGRVLLESEYPIFFKRYIADAIHYYYTYIEQDSAFSEKSKTVLTHWRDIDDALLWDLMLRIPWHTQDKDLLTQIYESNTTHPQSRLCAIECLGEADPEGMKPVFYALLDDYSIYEAAEVIRVLIALSRMVNVSQDISSDIPHKTQQFLDNYLSSGSTYTTLDTGVIINLVGGISGETQTHGMLPLLYKHRKRIPNLDFNISLLSSTLYPQVNELLLSASNEDVGWALQWVSGFPLSYYTPNLQQMVAEGGLYSSKVAALIELIEAENLYNPRPDLG